MSQFRSVLLSVLAAAALVNGQYYTGDGPYTGDGTYFAPGLGACGITNTDADFIVAVGALFFDNYPGATTNPNLNPICNLPITATYNGTSVSVTITDRCTECAGAWDLDFSTAAMSVIVPDYINVGRVSGVSWVIDGGSTTVTSTATTSTTTTTATSTSITTTSTTSTSSGGGSGSCSGASAWSASVAYTQGEQVTYNGDLWTATSWNEDEAPGGSSGAWTNDGACVDAAAAAHPAVRTPSSRFFNGF